jgi:hypothetical protein
MAVFSHVIAHGKSISSPLHAIAFFFQIYANFKWENECITIFGFRPCAQVAANALQPDQPEDSHHATLDTFVAGLQKRLATSGAKREDKGASFVPCACNVRDPLTIENENIGHTVTKEGLVRMVQALKGGQRHLAAILRCMQTSNAAKGGTHSEAMFDAFFSSTRRRVCHQSSPSGCGGSVGGKGKCVFDGGSDAIADTLQTVLEATKNRPKAEAGGAASGKSNGKAHIASNGFSTNGSAVSSPSRQNQKSKGGGSGGKNGKDGKADGKADGKEKTVIKTVISHRLFWCVGSLVVGMLLMAVLQYMSPTDCGSSEQYRPEGQQRLMLPTNRGDSSSCVCPEPTVIGEDPAIVGGCSGDPLLEAEVEKTQQQVEDLRRQLREAEDNGGTMRRRAEELQRRLNEAGQGGQGGRGGTGGSVEEAEMLVRVKQLEQQVVEAKQGDGTMHERVKELQQQLKTSGESEEEAREQVNGLTQQVQEGERRLRQAEQAMRVQGQDGVEAGGDGSGAAAHAVCAKDLNACTVQLRSATAAADNGSRTGTNSDGNGDAGCKAMYSKSALSQWMKLGSATTLYIDETKLPPTSEADGIPVYDYRFVICMHFARLLLLGCCCSAGAAPAAAPSSLKMSFTSRPPLPNVVTSGCMMSGRLMVLRPTCLCAH